MKNSLKHLTLFFLVAISLFSCKSKSTKQESETVNIYNSFEYQGGAIVEWTAYKTNEKIGVSGTLDSVFIYDTKNADSPEKVFENSTFVIPVKFLDSKNPGRDDKINKFFFGNLLDTVITGSVVRVDSVSMSVNLKMNGITKEVLFNIDKQSNTIILESVISLTDWDANKAIETLNEECKLLHTGKDGISILWPEIKLKFVAVLY